MKEADMWKTNEARRSCEGMDKKPVRPCLDTKCNAKVSTDPEASLASVLISMSDLKEDRLTKLTRLLRPKPTHKQVLFVTAASSNHYQESQALIHNLIEYVFPLLTNYSFVFYDLGLSVEERSEANLPMADTLMWMDTSVRFMQDDIRQLMDTIEQSRVIINDGMFPMGQHATIEMFKYFRESTCSFSAIPEFENNYIGFKNDRLIREAVVKPWTACALNPLCMCPVNHLRLLRCGIGKWKYNECHRFDQAALGIILVKLFRNHENNIRVVVNIRRGHTEEYFETLNKTNGTD